MRLFLSLILIIVSVTALEAKKSTIDHLGLAALLIRDGHYDRALKSLAEVDVKDEATDLKRFYTLKALALMKQAHYLQSIEAFKQALHRATKPLSREDKRLYIYIGKSYFQLKSYKKALETFERVPQIVQSKASYLILKAEMQYKSALYSEALKTLEQSIARFPDAIIAYKQRFFYLVHLKLFESALQSSSSYIKKSKDGTKASMLVAQAFIKEQELDRALKVLTQATLRYPDKSDIIVMLAHLYMKKGMLNSAAELFDEASIFERKYIKEASELYRRAKRFYRSLYLNTQIKDQKEKLRQRLAIYLEFEDYERAAAMRKAMKRVGLLKEQELRYALAFALFKSGQYALCEEELSFITKSELFSKAIELRKSIQVCKIHPWECH